LAEQVLDLVLALHQPLQARLERLDRSRRLRVRAAARLVGSAGEAEPAVVGQRRVALDALRYLRGDNRLGSELFLKACSAAACAPGFTQVWGLAVTRAGGALPGGAHPVPFPMHNEYTVGWPATSTTAA